MTALPIHHGHALRAAVLPEHHRDPFDRMLVAQAQLEGLQLMTEDKLVARYDVEILSGRGSGAIPPPPEPDAEDADTEGTS